MTPTVPSTLDDPHAVAVFADALEAAGDPRGVLTHLQLAREERPHDARLAEAEARHLALHAKGLLGGLATASSMVRLRWRRGFLCAVAFHSEARDAFVRRRGARVPSPARSRLPRLLRELGRLPVSSRLEELSVSMHASSFCVAHLTEALDEVLALRLPTLRLARLQVLVPLPASWGDEDLHEPRAGAVVASHGALRLEVDTALRPRLERLGLVAPLPPAPLAARPWQRA